LDNLTLRLVITIDMSIKIMMADSVGFVELLETFDNDLTVANATDTTPPRS